MRSCEYYNDKFTLEQMRKYCQKKLKKAGAKEETSKPAVEGSTKANSKKPEGSEPDAKQPRGEAAKLSMEFDTTDFTNAELCSKEFSLICRGGAKTIDLILDTGTVSNLVPEDQRDLVQNLHAEDTALMGVGGTRVLARETGETGVFGKTRIVPGTGAICVSQRQFGRDFQMLNPHKDIVVLRGWPGTKYANREFVFERDDRDQLLHCKLCCASELALVARGANFYQPEELPSVVNVSEEPSDVMLSIRRLHEYYSHPSINEMKRVASKWFKDKVILIDFFRY